METARLYIRTVCGIGISRNTIVVAKRFGTMKVNILAIGLLSQLRDSCGFTMINPISNL
jgi:hypothetical protein